SGFVELDGVRIKGPEEQLIPGHREIAYLSQHFELRNIYTMGELLSMSSLVSKEEEQRICRLCRVENLIQRTNKALSGGEKQRMALALLLVRNPAVLLLDEPFSNLDLIHKNLVLDILAELNQQFGTTLIMSTHDPADVLSWANELVILDKGKILERGLPEQVYDNPGSSLSAGLMGSFSELPAKLLVQMQPASGPKLDQRFFRPGKFEVDEIMKNGSLQGNVLSQKYLGDFYETSVSVSGSTIIARSMERFGPGSVVFITLKCPG
ncbi:MAG: ATP-binding cassette domain-containing protein, partial [Chitinophagaceae bacterium]